MTDITEHRTREGKIYCCAVTDTCSRRIIGWSIDSVQDAQLVVKALDMAIQHAQSSAARSCTLITASSSPRSSTTAAGDTPSSTTSRPSSWNFHCTNRPPDLDSRNRNGMWGRSPTEFAEG
jgi:transposase InsO family protein